jgi:hypothetical protein
MYTIYTMYTMYTMYTLYTLYTLCTMCTMYTMYIWGFSEQVLQFVGVAAGEDKPSKDKRKTRC